MKQHSPAFLKIVEDAMKSVTEVTVAQTMKALTSNPNAALIDVREESEYAKGHVTGAEHIGKGVIERDIELLHPDPEEELFLYCGGGFRSALAGEALARMGYKKVFSVAGGWRAFVDAGVEVSQ